MKTVKTTEINGQINDPEVRLIGEEGEQLGIMSSAEARKIAYNANLDLVKIAPAAQPPVCRIMDYGKYLFDRKKKEKENSRKQTVVELKEIQLSATIDVGDIKIKAAQTAKFLAKGNKIKIGLRLRGRQMQHADLAFKVIEDFLSMLEEGSFKIDKPAKLEGRTITAYLSPVTSSK